MKSLVLLLNAIVCQPIFSEAGPNEIIQTLSPAQTDQVYEPEINKRQSVVNVPDPFDIQSVFDDWFREEKRTAWHFDKKAYTIEYTDESKNLVGLKILDPAKNNFYKFDHERTYLSKFYNDYEIIRIAKGTSEDEFDLYFNYGEKTGYSCSYSEPLDTLKKIAVVLNDKVYKFNQTIGIKWTKPGKTDEFNWGVLLQEIDQSKDGLPTIIQATGYKVLREQTVSAPQEGVVVVLQGTCQNGFFYNVNQATQKVGRGFLDIAQSIFDLFGFK